MVNVKFLHQQFNNSTIDPREGLASNVETIQIKITNQNCQTPSCSEIGRLDSKILREDSTEKAIKFSSSSPSRRKLSGKDKEQKLQS